MVIINLIFLLKKIVHTTDSFSILLMLKVVFRKTLKQISQHAQTKMINVFSHYKCYISYQGIRRKRKIYRVELVIRVVMLINIYLVFLMDSFLRSLLYSSVNVCMISFRLKHLLLVLCLPIFFILVSSSYLFSDKN